MQNVIFQMRRLEINSTIHIHMMQDLGECIDHVVDPKSVKMDYSYHSGNRSLTHFGKTHLIRGLGPIHT